MSFRRSIGVASFAVGLVVCASVPAAYAGSHWTIFAGNNRGEVVPESINATGTVAGFLGHEGGGAGSGPFFRTKDGTITTFQVPLSQSAGAAGINDSGVIAGGYSEHKTIHGYLRAADGSITSFDAPGAGQGPYQGTEASAINNSGVITGMLIDAQSVWHGFIRAADASFVTFDAPNGTIGVEVYGINDSGTVAGDAWDNVGAHHGIVRAVDGTITIFDAPGAGAGDGQGTRVSGINAGGSIAGEFVDSNNAAHGYVRDPSGTIQTFDAPDATDTVPRAINALGEVVGTVIIGGNEEGFARKPDGTIHTFKVDGGIAMVLTLNDSGQIAGECQKCRGTHRDFVGFLGKQ